MHLTKFEQSGFILETRDGFRLAWDIGNKTPIDRLRNVNSVDVFLVSHSHGDHFSLDHIKQLSPKALLLNHECATALAPDSIGSEISVVKAGDNVEVGGIEITCFAVDHGPNYSVENLGFLIRADGTSLYFAGDMFYPSGISPEGLEVDYAILPVGAPNTFGPKEAFTFARRFGKIGRIICMHYEKNPANRDEFLDLVRGSFDAE